MYVRVRVVGLTAEATQEEKGKRERENPGKRAKKNLSQCRDKNSLLHTTCSFLRKTTHHDTIQLHCIKPSITTTTKKKNVTHSVACERFLCCFGRREGGEGARKTKTKEASPPCVRTQHPPTSLNSPPPPVEPKPRRTTTPSPPPNFLPPPPSSYDNLNGSAKETKSKNKKTGMKTRRGGNKHASNTSS